MERVFEYVGSAMLAFALTFLACAVAGSNPWVLLLFPGAFLLLVLIHEAAQVWINTRVGENEEGGVYSRQWDEMTTLSAYTRVEERLLPDEKLESKLQRYAVEYSHAKSDISATRGYFVVSGLYLAIAIVMLMVAITGVYWSAALLVALVVLLIFFRPPGLSRLFRPVVAVVVCSGIAIASFIVATRIGRPFALPPMRQNPLADMADLLLWLGVAAPVGFLILLAAATTFSTAIENAETDLECASGRAFAIAELIAAINGVCIELAWPSARNREEVGRHLGLASFFVRWGLKEATASSGLTAEEIAVYSSAKAFLLERRKAALFPSVDTYRDLRRTLEQVLYSLLSQQDGELAEWNAAPAGGAPSESGSGRRRRTSAVRGAGKTLLVALLPALALGCATLVRLPLSEEIGSFATLFSVLWAAGTLIYRIDPVGFSTSLDAVRSMRSVVLGEPGSGQSDAPNDGGNN